MYFLPACNTLKAVLLIQSRALRPAKMHKGDLVISKHEREKYQEVGLGLLAFSFL